MDSTGSKCAVLSAPLNFTEAIKTRLSMRGTGDLTMYEGLVKELRKAAYIAKMQGSNPFRFVAHYIAAADAIEELCVIIDGLNQTIKMYEEQEG
jgi:hypothetical protein